MENIEQFYENEESKKQSVRNELNNLLNRIESGNYRTDELPHLINKHKRLIVSLSYLNSK